jgi:hypothetical protein
MKQIRFTLATYFLIGSVIFSLAVFIIPPMRFVFGEIIWDHWILSLYETTGIFHFWYLFFFATVFIFATYVFSRDILWRYVFNRIVIEIISWFLNYSRIIKFYHMMRKWVSSWYPFLYWGILQRFEPQEAKNHLEKLGESYNYMPPNRRFLAALRARMDIELLMWQNQLISPYRSSARIEPTTMRCLIDMIDLWQDHFLIDKPSQCQVPEPVFSTLVIALEWMSVCQFSSWVTGRDAQPFRDDLDRRICKLLSMLPEEIRNQARVHYFIVQSNRADNLHLVESLAAYKELLDFLIKIESGPSSPVYPWLSALIWQQMVLHAQWLTMHGYSQEAIQIYFEAKTYIEPVKPSEVSLDPFWHIVMAQSSQEGWGSVVLSEAWEALASSSSTLFQKSFEEHSLVIPNAKLPPHVENVRRAYEKYTNNQFHSAKFIREQLIPSIQLSDR